MAEFVTVDYTGTFLYSASSGDISGFNLSTGTFSPQALLPLRLAVRRFYRVGSSANLSCLYRHPGCSTDWIASVSAFDAVAVNDNGQVAGTFPLPKGRTICGRVSLCRRHNEDVAFSRNEHR